MKIVISHSYVSLPEGIIFMFSVFFWLAFNGFCTGLMPFYFWKCGWWHHVPRYSIWMTLILQSKQQSQDWVGENLQVQTHDFPRKPIHRNGPQVEFHWIWLGKVWGEAIITHSIWMVNESNESWVSGSDVPGLEAVRPTHRQRPGLRDGRGPDSPLGRPKRRPRPCRLAMGSMGPAIVDLVTV